MEPNPSAPTEAKSSTRRRPLAPQEITGDDPKSREERVILELMRALNIGKLIAFTGSGVSAVYGLPTWPELCEKTASACWKQTCTIDKNSKIYGSIEAIRTKLLDELLLRRLQKLHSEAFEALSEKFRAPLSDIELLSYADAALGMLESSQEDAELDTAKNILAEIAQPYCVRERMTKEAAFGVLSDLVGPDAEKLLQGIQKDAWLPADVDAFIRAIAPDKPQIRSVSTKEYFLRKPIENQMHYFDPLIREHADDTIKSEIRVLIASLQGDSTAKKALVRKDKAALTQVDSTNARHDEKKLSRLLARRPLVDPLGWLLRELNVSRFATLNIDLEIEAALEDEDYPFDTLTNKKTVSRQESRSGALSQSITLRPHDTAELLSLATDTQSRGAHIVHIHGSSKAPEGMVVTQDRYNRLYVAPHVNRQSFEDVRELLVTANAVVFTGIGLTEDDVMRPMRIGLGANHGPRQLYALMPLLKSEAQSIAEAQRIRALYGIHVVIFGRRKKNISRVWWQQDENKSPHPLDTGNEDSDNYFSLAEELNNLKALNKADDWLGQLIVRAPKFARVQSVSWVFDALKALSSAPKIIPVTQKRALIEWLKTIASAQALCQLYEIMRDQTRAWRRRWDLKPHTDPTPMSVRQHYRYHCREHDRATDTNLETLYGNEADKWINSAVSGKKLIISVPSGCGKGGLFAYLANTLKPGKIKYMALSLGTTLHQEHLLDRIEKFIHVKGGIILIHGAARLLDRRAEHTIDFRTDQVLRALGKSRIGLILIASPTVGDVNLCKILNAKTVHFKPITPHKSTPAPNVKDGPFLARHPIRSKWFECHWQAALGQLNPVEQQDYKSGYERMLAANVERASEDRRLTAHVHASLSALEFTVNQFGDKNARIHKVLEHIVLKWMYAFALPTTVQVFDEIDEIQEVKKVYGSGVTVRDVLTHLVSLRLCFKLESIKPRERYILHDGVRAYLAHLRGLSFSWVSGREWSSLSLCHVLMDHEPLLSAEAFQQSRDLFDKLVESTVRDTVRSAYGLLRGSLFLSSVMRAGLEHMAHGPQSILDEHLRRLLRLRACLEDEGHEGVASALYDADRAWLLNEIAVVRFVQGNFHDALMLFREVALFLKVTSDPCARLRVQLNMATCLIERGYFAETRKLLTEAIVEIETLERPFTSTDKAPHPELMLLKSLALGLLSEVFLLGAKIKESNDSVDAALGLSEAIDVVGLRGWLHFKKASVLAAQGDGKANDSLEKAMAHARSAQRPDLLLSLEIAEVEGMLQKATASQPALLMDGLTQLKRCDVRARQLGIDKAVVAANLVRARIFVALNQVEALRRASLDAVSLAMRSGMRLKRVSGLTVFVVLMILRGEHDAAKKVLRDLKQTAEGMRYIRATLSLERIERAIGVEGAIEAWARGAADAGPFLDQRT